jgi:hypothetical protein
MAVAADARVVTDAVKALLVAGGLTVGDGVAPSGNPPYAVVYPVFHTVTGPVGEPSADANRVFQVTSVGTTREQAQWVSDKAATALLGADHNAVTVTGRALMQAIELYSSAGVTRDDDTAGAPLFYAIDRYAVTTTDA